MRVGRSFVALAAGLLAVTLASQPAYADSPQDTHRSGIDILRDPLPDLKPMPDDIATIVAAARDLTEELSESTAYPYYDIDEDVVVITATTQAEASSIIAKLPETTDAVPTKIRIVDRPRALLDAIMDELIGAQPGGLMIVASYQDPENNRVILEMPRYTDAYLDSLAARIDPKSIAVRTVPDEPEDLLPAARNNDTSPFWGGARLTVGCTTGFPWKSGSTEMMLTAGHCYPTGSTSVATPSQAMGKVTSGSRENWTTGVGTQYLTGQSTYRGDLALIEMTGSRLAGYSVYRGGPGSNSSGGLTGMWSRSPNLGDQYCTGGMMSGEQCGWSVKWSAAGNYTYSGSGEIARRVWRGEKYGLCIIGGDSGGPVYTVVGSNQILAKGIISGAKGIGGSDNKTVWPETPCRNIFTDIRDANSAFPGGLKS